MTQEKRIRYLKHEISSVKESIESLSEFLTIVNGSQKYDVPLHAELMRLINQDVLLGFRRILERPDPNDVLSSGTLESLMFASSISEEKKAEFLHRLKNIRSNAVFRNVNEVVKRSRVAHTDSRKYDDVNVIHLGGHGSAALMLINQVTDLFREVINENWQPKNRFHFRRLLAILKKSYEF